MSHGIIVFGAPGSGQTTVGREAARRLDFPHFDLDDYHWRWDTEIPYTVFRSAEERTEHLLGDISGHPYFVMSGSMWSIRKAFEPMFTLAVFITASAEVRAKRICEREHARWGYRILPGSDMHEAHATYRMHYLDRVLQYDNADASQFGLKQHEQWIATLPCPVLHIDGAIPVEENVKQIVAHYNLQN